MARIALLAVMALSWSLPTVAQTPLTLERAIEEALTRNPALRGARATIEEADAGTTTARAGYFPKISFTEAWQRGNHPVYVFGSLLSSRQFGAANFAVDALNHPEPIGFFHGMFAVEQLLFDGGRTRSGVDAARRRRDVAALQVDQAAADLALGVTQAYGRVLAARAAQRSAEGAIAAAEEDSARATRRRDLGSATDADVLALSVHLADARQRAIQARGDAAVACAELSRLTGRPVTGQCDVQEPPVTSSTGSPDVPALLAEAEASRPEFRQAEIELELAQTAVRQARAAWWPQIAAQAGYELNGTQFTNRASAWAVGGELRWNLSVGGAEAAGQRSAAAGLTRARAMRDDAQAAVHLDVMTALQRLESARAREAVSRSAVDQARETQRIVRDRYEAGLVGINDVLRTATAVLDANTQRIGALVETLTSEAMLRRAVGRRL